MVRGEGGDRVGDPRQLFDQAQDVLGHGLGTERLAGAGRLDAVAVEVHGLHALVEEPPHDGADRLSREDGGRELQVARLYAEVPVEACVAGTELPGGHEGCHPAVEGPLTRYPETTRHPAHDRHQVALLLGQEAQLEVGRAVLREEHVLAQLAAAALPQLLDQRGIGLRVAGLVAALGRHESCSAHVSFHPSRPGDA